jgi:hypothetical protein
MRSGELIRRDTQNKLPSAIFFGVAGMAKYSSPTILVSDNVWIIFVACPLIQVHSQLTNSWILRHLGSFLEIALREADKNKLAPWRQ